MTENLWEELTQHPEHGKPLLASADADPQSLLDQTKAFLRGNRRSDEWVTVDSTYRALGGPGNRQPSAARGAAGFIALTARVMRPDLFGAAQSSLDEAALDTMAQYFEDPMVKAWVTRLYALPASSADLLDKKHCTCRLDLPHATFHRPGTTSFILHCYNAATCARHPTDLALKLILLPYTTATFSGVTMATRQAASAYQRLRYGADSQSPTPDVYLSGRDYVVMEFVEGRTLEQLLVDPLPSLEPWLKHHNVANTRFGLLRSVGAALVQALGNMRLQPAQGQAKGTGIHVAHLDLSPANVIVKRFDPERIELVLLDIGKNHLLTSEVGAAPLVMAAERYAPPELRGRRAGVGDTLGPVPPDVYSLGMILLELADRPWEMGGSTPAPHMPGRARDRNRPVAPQAPGVPVGSRRTTSEVLSRLYRHAPEIGRLLEGMVEENPALRLVGFPPGARIDPYASLHQRLCLQIELSEVAARTTPKGVDDQSSIRSMVSLFRFREPQALLRSAVAQLPSPASGSNNISTGGLTTWGAIKRLLAARKRAEHLPDAARLGLWAAVCSVAWYVSFATVVSYSLNDLHAWRRRDLAGRIASHLPRIAKTASVVPYGPSNLPGRLVALTFALVATRYYLNIFSTLTSRGQVGSYEKRRARWTEVAMRGNAVAFLVVVVVGNATNPRLWPLFSAAAVWAAWNNWLCHSLATDNLKEARKAGSTTLGEDVFADVEEYGTWWWLMLTYAAGLGALGIAFAVGLARDQLVDALAVAIGVNVFKLYVGNCGKLAPTVRACLGRAFAAGQRL